MRIDQIEYVVAAHQQQSISQAAESLFVTQPSLSRAITALEKELGVQLFHRTYQGASLTPIGEKLLPHFEAILEEKHRIDAVLAEEQAQDISATLRISASAIMCNNLLPDTIQQFQQSYPNIEIDIQEEYDADIVDAIAYNKADIGFLSISPDLNQNIFSVLKEKQLSHQMLLKSSVVALLSANSPLAKLESVSLEQLASMPLILDKKVKQFVQPSMESAKHIMFAQDRDARTKMILKNQGYCVVPSLEMYNDFYVQQGLMAAIPYTNDDSMDKGVELWIVHNKKELKFYEQDFIDTLRRLLLESSV